MKRWLLGLGLRFGEWLVRSCDVMYCVHCGERPAVTWLPYGGQDPDAIASIRGGVCAECVHKQMPDVAAEFSA